MDKQRKLELIQAQIDDARRGQPEDFRLWLEKTDVILRSVLGDANATYSNFKKISYSPGMWSSSSPPGYFEAAQARGVKQAIAVLEAAKVEVDLLGGAPEPKYKERSAGSGIFIVHGRDKALKHEVARFIRNLTDNEPTILHEQANSGSTLIEKFEEYAAKTAYAIVLATADDVGRAKDASTDNPRARQNVVFELGFFFGALGRSRVACLYESDVELPSDINGIVYIRLDEGGAWKQQLAREVEDAGVGVDWSALKQ